MKINMKSKPRWAKFQDICPELQQYYFKYIIFTIALLLVSIIAAIVLKFPSLLIIAALFIFISAWNILPGYIAEISGKVCEYTGVCEEIFIPKKAAKFLITSQAHIILKNIDFTDKPLYFKLYIPQRQNIQMGCVIKFYANPLTAIKICEDTFLINDYITYVVTRRSLN